jgi:hypothetical protein
MSNFNIVNLSEYTAPLVVEDKRKEWVTYGEDNSYFDFLIERFKGSATNNAIINNSSRLIFGKGLGAKDGKRKPADYANMISLFSKSDIRKMVLELKMLGQCAIQVHYSKDRKTIEKTFHIPVQLLAPEKCNDEGDIEGYYYSDDWSDVRTYEPRRIPAFGFSQENIEILYVKPYAVGMKYFSNVDYQGGLPYAVLEEEIADYLINDTINGFSGTKVVNFNNGVPDKEKQLEVKSDVLNKLTGSRGEKVIVAFNNNAESKTTIDDIPLNDAPAHYQYLSDEAFRKLIVGHRVTSPMLLGVRDGNSGLGNNADEIKTATLLFDNLTINTYQEEFTDALEDILAINNISLNLYFKTIQPLEFTDTTGMDAETKEEETGIKMSVQCSAESSEFDNEIAKELIDQGEDLGDDWELIDEREVDYDLEDELDAQIEAMNSTEPSLLSKIWNFVSTGTATPNSKSKQDKEIDGVKYKVRYKYSPARVSQDSREFCKKMVQADKLYRKEDIIAMESRSVNKGWGPEGVDTYSVWFYKGGGSCHHKWLRQTFKGKTEGNLSNVDPNISTNKARQDGFNPVNEKEVSMKPKDMPFEGFLPTNKRFN